MKGPRLAWVLNLDAEHELELELGRRHTPSRALRSIVERQARRLRGRLVAEEDIVLGEPGAELAPGCIGLAWSPTPSALERLARSGATPLTAPSLEVLREVNARPFAARLHAHLPAPGLRKGVVGSLAAALAELSRPAPLGWLVRRTFGAAGRGRRRIAAGRPDPPELAWLQAGLRRGPLVIEPWVRVTRESTRSGWVRAHGGVQIAPPCFQRTSEQGAWLETRAALPSEVLRGDDALLEEAVQRAGTRLAEAGYFGPFGIDAFHYRAAPGEPERFNPLSEINARFTMDWTTGMDPGGLKGPKETLPAFLGMG